MAPNPGSAGWSGSRTFRARPRCRITARTRWQPSPATSIRIMINEGLGGLIRAAKHDRVAYGLDPSLRCRHHRMVLCDGEAWLFDGTVDRAVRVVVRTRRFAVCRLHGEQGI